MSFQTNKVLLPPPITSSWVWNWNCISTLHALSVIVFIYAALVMSHCCLNHSVIGWRHGLLFPFSLKYSPSYFCLLACILNYFSSVCSALTETCLAQLTTQAVRTLLNCLPAIPFVGCATVFVSISLLSFFPINSIIFWHCQMPPTSVPSVRQGNAHTETTIQERVITGRIRCTTKW